MSKTKKVSKIISSLLRLKSKTTHELATIQEVSDQAIRNKLSRSNYKVEDLIEFAEFLGVDVGFRDGENFYSFLETTKENKQKSDQ